MYLSVKINNTSSYVVLLTTSIVYLKYSLLLAASKVTPTSNDMSTLCIVISNHLVGISNVALLAGQIVHLYSEVI